MSLASLITAGFERAGAWRLADGGNTIVLEGNAARGPGVYVIVANGQVCYVGSAQRGLHRRFRGYAKTQSLKTAMRVRNEIMTCLASGAAVDIFTLCPPIADVARPPRGSGCGS